MSQSFKKIEDLMKNRNLKELEMHRTNSITTNDSEDTGEYSNIIDKYGEFFSFIKVILS
jgi:hypothetical protein